jgi:hypothetical protein
MKVFVDVASVVKEHQAKSLYFHCYLIHLMLHAKILAPSYWKSSLTREMVVEAFSKKIILSSIG